MPFPILAHQAPVLPLKAFHKGGWNGTALALGSMAPDLQLLFWSGDSTFGHSFAGQFLFCLPVTMVVVLLMGHLRLGEALAARFPRLAWLTGAGADVARPGGFARAVVSALVGSFSHLALDALAHDVLPEWLPPRTFHVHGLVFSMRTVSQLSVSIVAAGVTLALLPRVLAKHDAPPRRPGAWVVVALALGGGALAFSRSLPELRHPTWYFEAGPVYVWGFVFFMVVAGGAGGALVAAAGLARWDRRKVAG